MSKEKDSKGLGLSAKKEDNFSDWYSDLLVKAELADYAPIKGFMIIRPNAYSIWQKIQENFNEVLKRKGIKNSYFPLLIPENFFKREAEHAKGFAPELAFLEGKEEGERLALRPTSETIVYDSYSKWIRSWRDLPLKLNQWSNTIRWEVKQTKPFIRTREFLWQEGHCAFATEKEAEENMREMIHSYKELVEELLAIPVLMGKKSKHETFPGSHTTMTIEALMPDGKALQCGTSHKLGQGFAKAFNVKYRDKQEKEQHVWLTSWGFSTRLIGAVAMMHGDDKGLVIPPRVAEHKAVIVPILFEDSREKVIKKAKEIEKKLGKLNPILDLREGYSPGWKFSEHELKGIPLRIEIGPKDLAKKQVTIVRRDNGHKIVTSEKTFVSIVDKTLEEMQNDLFNNAKRLLHSKMDEAKTLKELKEKLEKGKIVKVHLVDSEEVERKLKDETQATSRIIEEGKPGTCIITHKKTNTIAYVARSY